MIVSSICVQALGLVTACSMHSLFKRQKCPCMQGGISAVAAGAYSMCIVHDVIVVVLICQHVVRISACST